MSLASSNTSCPLTRTRLAILLAFLSVLVASPPACARTVPGFGTVAFGTSCKPAAEAAFEVALARLHDFDRPERAFRAVAAADPHCAIAWWGAAMAVRGNPLAGAPDRTALEAGRAHVAQAQAAGPAAPREAGLIAAMAVYYRDPDEDHAARTLAYEAAMRRLAEAYPDDAEVQSFFALAILEAVDLTDTTHARQIEAGRILEQVWAQHPDHPGAPHYLIHAYDYPPLAARALPAARRYAAIAPASMHAQHMPSHIYSMLGLWQDSIAANRAAARLMTPDAHPATAWLDTADPHGMDFIAYAHLQLGEDGAVAQSLAMAGPSEERTLVAARFLLERGDWTAAASMPARGLSSLEAVTVRFVRALGAARSGQPAAARDEVAALRRLRPAVLRDEGGYWAGLVDVYADAAEAWADYAAGDRETALSLMREAAARDDGREKHIWLENKLLPMRELYGDLLLDLGRPGEALTAFEASFATAPNRFNGFLGAARAARALGREDEARRRYAEAAALVALASPGRPGIVEARQFSTRP
jgi:tetratricopeptide (TPR) repeat protein